MLPMTEYAPKWNISIGSTVWDQPEKVDAIRDWLLTNEERIKKEFPALHDGGTGLGDNSVTSRYGRYNLFDFASELPEFSDLLTHFRKTWIDFVETDQTPYLDLDIVCWFNIMRNDQAITEHSHGAGPLSYLSGNMHLGNYNTKTFYRTPFLAQNYLPVDNIKGGTTLFPSYVYHKTDTFISDEPRLSIAFDLRMPDNTDPMLKSIRFMDENIFNSIKSLDKQ